MNFVGKILVVLILVMSLVFMGFAVAVYATHKNWQEIVMRTEADANATGAELGLKYQLEQAEEEYRQLEDQFAQLQETVASEETMRREQLKALETEVAQLKTERDAMVAQEQQLQQQIREQTAAASMAGEMLNNKLTQLEELRADLQKTRDARDQQFAEVVRLQDEFQQAQVDKQRLEGQNTQLANMLAQAKLVLDRNSLKLESSVDGLPPKVDGVILASNADLVEISLGSDDGIVRGHTLEVFRNVQGRARYLGRVQVLQTLPDKSVAKIIPEYQQGRIERDDRVATRVN